MGGGGGGGLNVKGSIRGDENVSTLGECPRKVPQGPEFLKLVLKDPKLFFRLCREVQYA